jgi:hypothetical protein
MCIRVRRRNKKVLKIGGYYVMKNRRKGVKEEKS